MASLQRSLAAMPKKGDVGYLQLDRQARCRKSRIVRVPAARAFVIVSNERAHRIFRRLAGRTSVSISRMASRPTGTVPVRSRQPVYGKKERCDEVGASHRA